MKKFLLLVLSLMAGSKVSSKIIVCANAWVELTCKYPNTDISKYYSVHVVIPNKQRTLQSSENNMWENKDGFLLFHDTENKNFRMIIKQLERDDFGKYTCQFFPGPGTNFTSSKVELDDESDGCPKPVNKTLYRKAKNTLTCQNKGKKQQIQFFCKENGVVCEDISGSPPLPNGRFALTNTDRGLSISISDVTSEDDGVYWCGVKSKDGNLRAALRKIHLKVKGSPPPTAAAASVSASVPSSSNPPQGGNSWTEVTSTSICVALLVFVNILAFVLYKRLKNPTRGRAQIDREDHIYAEIQEPPEKTDFRSVENIIYVSASFQTAPLMRDFTVTDTD